jgi:hypothetical protein
MTVTPEERQMAARGDKTRIPDVGWAPSTWPDTLHTQALTLGRRALEKWAKAVRRSGRVFIVLHIPREPEMETTHADQGTSVAWMAGVCEAENIFFVDPSPELVERRTRGEEVFFDHLATNGHAAVSDAFVECFEVMERWRARRKRQWRIRDLAIIRFVFQTLIQATGFVPESTASQISAHGRMSETDYAQNRL